MALIVEDGTSKADADSYISVSYANAHHSLRGLTSWNNLSSTEREQAIRRATDYMLAEYRTQWSGRRATSTQALDWPRANVLIDDAGPTEADRLYPSNIVPNEVKKACADLALKAAAGELLEDAGPQVIEDTIGPITTRWAETSTTPRTKYLQIDNMLRAFLSNGGNSMMVKLVRT